MSATICLNLTNDEAEALAEFKNRVIDEHGLDVGEDKHRLLRFLRAREFDVEKSHFMLNNHFEWRKKYRIDSIDNIIFPEVLQKFPVFSRLGEDKEGVLNVYLFFGNLDMRGLVASCKRSDVILSTLQFMESNVRRLEQKSKEVGRVIDKWNCVVDFTNVTLSNVTYKTGIELILQYFHFYEANYPERLNIAYVINASSYFHYLFNFIKPILTGRTLQKIKIFGKDGWQEELLKFIDPDQLPAFLGGNCTDPDGSPLCKTMLSHGGIIPKSYYLTKEERRKSRVGETGFKQYSVQRMSKIKINVQVDEPGSSIEWEFETENHDIGFGLTFRPRFQNSKARQMISIQRVDAQYLAEAGLFKCDESGMYTLIFDNRFSWFRQKEVFCRVDLVKPDGTRSSVA